MNNKLANYAIERAKEPSTWRGLILLLTGLGVAVKPDLMEGIIATGTVLAGAVGAGSKG